MSYRIKECMNQVFQSYKTLNNREETFWDVVVLTTFDEFQKKCFEKQIQELYGDDPLLKDRVKVVADPPNQKLGCGGSTLHVLKTVAKIYDSDLNEKKILIIHSGGHSQRLPSYSIQGKIFSPMPVKAFSDDDSRIFYMLDLKLAIYLPFCQCLGPGVFVSCGDDIESYYFDPGLLRKEDLVGAEVVALSHPYDLTTATGHGVYVLPRDLSQSGPVVVSECLEVLQKPSYSLMKEKKAIVKNEEADNEIVYGDSAFWMSPKTSRSLVSWFVNTSYDSEIDAYAHFLPCLGANMKDVSAQSFTDCRRELLPILRNINFKIILLKESKFYHLGTMEEYLTNFTDCKSFQDELSIVKDIWNSRHSVALENFPERKTSIISCLISENSLITAAKNSMFVIEWSVIEIPIHVCNNLILSNCVLKRSDVIRLTGKAVAFYGNFLYHTAPVRHMDRVLYVTVAFDISSNLKDQVSNTNQLCIASVPLDRIMKESGLTAREVLPNKKPYSLWNLKLFPASCTPEESFWRTHHFVHQIMQWKEDSTISTESLVSHDSCRYFSMEDIIQSKDLNVLLKDRRKLLDAINNTYASVLR